MYGRLLKIIFHEHPGHSAPQRAAVGPATAGTGADGAVTASSGDSDSDASGSEPFDLPQYWDPMPAGAAVHEVVIYKRPEGAGHMPAMHSRAWARP